MTDNLDVEMVNTLRSILGKLGDICGAIDALSLRIMAVAAVAHRAEVAADDVAVDLAWSRLEAAKVDEGAPAGSRGRRRLHAQPGRAVDRHRLMAGIDRWRSWLVLVSIAVATSILVGLAAAVAISLTTNATAVPQPPFAETH